MTQSLQSLNPTSDQKSFQFRGHHNTEYSYSSFHGTLDLALKYLYSRKNLERVALKKGYLTPETIHRLDNCVLDIWFHVVLLKLPKTATQKGLCRFISKKDFLGALIDGAIEASKEVTHVGCHRDKVSDFYVKSASSDEYYDLTLNERDCICSCLGHAALKTAFKEDPKMSTFLKKDSKLRGMMPDKHIFALWREWGVTSVLEYQEKYKQHLKRHADLLAVKCEMKQYGVSLRLIVPGHFNVCTRDGIVGTVDQRFNLMGDGNNYWINQKKIGRDRYMPADNIQYNSESEAAIGLAKYLNISQYRSKVSTVVTTVAASINNTCTVTTQKPRQRTLPDPFGGF